MFQETRWRNCLRSTYSQLKVKVPLYLFCCSELVHLELSFFSFNLPPTFKGFKNLVSFKASSVKFLGDSLKVFMASCPLLEILTLYNCCGVKYIDVSDVGFSKHGGKFCSVSRGASQKLRTVKIDRLGLTSESQEDIQGYVIEGLTSSGGIEMLHLGSGICKLLAAGGLDKLFPMTFCKLKTLNLYTVDFNEQLECFLTVSFIQSCPCVQQLRIWGDTPRNVTNASKYNFNGLWDLSFKMEHLQTVLFSNIVGHQSELKLIEMVLPSAPKLKKFFVAAEKLGGGEKSKILVKMMELSRASPEAKLISYDLNG